MSNDLDSLLWPSSSLHQLLHLLTESGYGIHHDVWLEQPPDDLVRPGALQLGRWIERSAKMLGLDAQAIEANYGQLERCLLNTGVALIRVLGNPSMFLGVVGSKNGQLSLLHPQGHQVKVPVAQVKKRLAAKLIEHAVEHVQLVRDEAGLTGQQADRLLDSLVDHEEGNRAIRGIWQLKHRQQQSLSYYVRSRAFIIPMVQFVMVQVIAYGMALASWAIIGISLLNNSIDGSVIIAWLLALFSMIALSGVGDYIAGKLTINFGIKLKQTLIGKAIDMPANEIKQKGVGELVGQVLESEVLDSMGLKTLLQAVTMLVQLLMAVMVLIATGVNGLMHGLMMVLLILISAYGTVAYCKDRMQWTKERISQSNTITEMIQARQTLLLQGQAHKDKREQQFTANLHKYTRMGKSMDAKYALLAAIIPRAWLFLSVTVIAYTLIFSTAQTHAIALSVGTSLMAFGSFRGLSQSLIGLSSLWAALSVLRQTLKVKSDPLHLPMISKHRDADSKTLLRLKNIDFHYANANGHFNRQILHNVSLTIDGNSKYLLTGPSGSGKSTLSKIIAGVEPDYRGLMLLKGYDIHSIGLDAWRQSVAYVPQFHENYLFSANLAFNLLLGRNWPPRPGDLTICEEVCRRLGLWPLIEKMPCGLMQQVGETGWHLSHGEQSRVFLARSILQEVELIILDESLAACDPPLLKQILSYLEELPQSVILIAHP